MEVMQQHGKYMENEIDPTIKNLVSAIGKAETGNPSPNAYNQKGKSGEFGRYQFMPNTWKMWSKETLGDENAQPTMENQNKVAYTKVKSWKDQGLNPAQIASKWNSGDENAYLNNHVGTNSQGVQYDTPGYTKKVSQYYNELKSGQGTQPQVPQAPTLEQPKQGGGMDLGTASKVAGGIGVAAGLGAGALALAPEVGAVGVGEWLGGQAANAGNAIKGAVASKIKGFLGIDGQPTDGAQSGTQDTQGIPNEQKQQAQQAKTDTEAAQDIERAEASKKAVDALSATLQTTPTGKLLSSQPQVQDSLSYMAHHGLIPDTSTGLNDFSKAIKDSSKMRGQLSEDIAQVLDVGGEKASLEEVKKHAYVNIEKWADVREQPQQKALVDKEIEQYRQHYGEEVSLGNLERSKREQGMAKGDWQKDTPSRNGHKSLYNAFRDTITDNTKNKDLYNRVMKEEQKSFMAEKLMKKMNGKKALEHKGILRGVLKTYGKYVGTYLGDKIGGPIGAIVGTMVGDYVEKKVDKKYGKTFFESKEGQKLMEIMEQRNPEIAGMLKKRIEEYGNEAEALAKKELKRTEYKNKKKGIMGNHDENTKNPYMPIEDLPNIVWGKPATPKKKKKEKGLLTIKA